VFTAAQLRSRDFLELVFGYVLILAALWSPNEIQRILFVFALVFIFATTFLSHPTDSQSLGLRISAPGRPVWIVLVAGTLAVCAFWVSSRLGSLHVPSHIIPPGIRFWLYLAWSFLQQFILQDFFLLRLLRLLPSKNVAVLTSGFLFATAPLPNPVLAPATLVWGLAACALFVRYRDLYSLGLTHAIFGITLAMTVPNSIHHQMRVGLGYLQYREPPHYRNQSSHIVSTDAWVIADAMIRCSSRHARP
jgi:hypothetical protein